MAILSKNFFPPPADHGFDTKISKFPVKTSKGGGYPFTSCTHPIYTYLKRAPPPPPKL